MKLGTTIIKISHLLLGTSLILAAWPALATNKWIVNPNNLRVQRIDTHVLIELKDGTVIRDLYYPEYARAVSLQTDLRTIISEAQETQDKLIIDLDETEVASKILSWPTGRARRPAGLSPASGDRLKQLEQAYVDLYRTNQSLQQKLMNMRARVGATTSPNYSQTQ